MSDAASPAQEKILIRTADVSSDFETCVDLQQAIWGYSTIDTVPEQMFVVAKKTGGQVLLALDAESAVGFALTFVGWKEGRLYLHSHMVGVRPEYQDRGVGRLLKVAQREDALSRGIDLIEWTFDPLQLKNARFNIARHPVVALFCGLSNNAPLPFARKAFAFPLIAGSWCCGNMLAPVVSLVKVNASRYDIR